MKKRKNRRNGGAKCAIGFSESINCTAANMWTEKFCHLYSESGDILYSAESAKNYVISQKGKNTGIESMCILSQGDVV